MPYVEHYMKLMTQLKRIGVDYAEQKEMDSTYASEIEKYQKSFQMIDGYLLYYVLNARDPEERLQAELFFFCFVFMCVYLNFE